MNNKTPKKQEIFNEDTISALNEVDEMRKHSLIKRHSKINFGIFSP